jgi:hypothetical protein
MAKKEKRQIFLGLNFRLAVNMLQLINLRFKKAQQLTVFNAFPAQDFI